MPKSPSVKSSAIAKFLGARLEGADAIISHVTTLDDLRKGSLAFARNFDKDTAKAINKSKACLVICAPEYKGLLKTPHILSKNAGLAFVKTVARFFAPPRETGIMPTAMIDKKAKIGKRVFIGHNAVVGPDVSIGDNTSIGNNVVIAGKVKIGKGCTVKSNAVIGEPGFGFEVEADGTPFHFPHTGSIEIGDGVWIGAGSTVERAHITKTVIGNNVKIDDLVQVGHNCVLGENSMITSGTVLCGAAVIGKNAWIAPNTSVKEKVKIGVGAFVGLGSVVIRDVPANTVVVGNPAAILKRK
jgi:UDP-3-O-[3-hydroxymyristoyl] glucosamine N-acyltransferase